MKILQVTSFFKPSWEAGGIAKISYDISRRLVQRGHEITVYTTDGFKSRVNVQKNRQVFLEDMNVFYFSNMSLFLASRNLCTPFMAPLIARKHMEEFDIIHVHTFRTLLATIIGHYANKYGIPYVMQAHGSVLPFFQKQRLKKVFDFLFGYSIIRGASKVIALTETEAQQYKSMDVPKEKIEVIPNGIDLSEYDHLPPEGAFRKKFSINEDERIILYVGRIHESKGLDLLAHGFKIVSKDLNNVRLVVVGPDDGYAATFSALLSDLGVNEKVLLTGFVDKEDKLAALVDSNVFVTPRYRGFPVVFLEACLTGCPIVTASNELEWVHDNVGYITDNSPIALAKAISNVLQDGSIMERFRDNCRGTIKNFDISTTTGRLETVYKSVVNR